jgi:hypothetical protein
MKMRRMMMSKYEVQENFLCGGWTNAWHTDDEPTIFESLEEAEIALNDFFEDCKYALIEGFVPDMPDPEDFRIVEVKDE